jgi:hypothetical protein
MAQCFAFDPAERPLFVDVLKALRSLPSCASRVRTDTTAEYHNKIQFDGEDEADDFDARARRAVKPAIRRETLRQPVVLPETAEFVVGVTSLQG